jgi:hypothetical protein
MKMYKRELTDDVYNKILNYVKEEVKKKDPALQISNIDAYYDV